VQETCRRRRFPAPGGSRPLGTLPVDSAMTGDSVHDTPRQTVLSGFSGAEPVFSIPGAGGAGPARPPDPRLHGDAETPAATRVRSSCLPEASQGVGSVQGQIQAAAFRGAGSSRRRCRQGADHPGFGVGRRGDLKPKIGDLNPLGQAAPAVLPDHPPLAVGWARWARSRLPSSGNTIESALPLGRTSKPAATRTTGYWSSNPYQVRETIQQTL